MDRGDSPIPPPARHSHYSTSALHIVKLIGFTLTCNFINITWLDHWQLSRARPKLPSVVQRHTLVMGGWNAFGGGPHHEGAEEVLLGSLLLGWGEVTEEGGGVCVFLAGGP